MSSLIPIFIPYNSARENPNTSANPQHLALFPVLSGTLPLPLDPPPSPFFTCIYGTLLKEPRNYWHCELSDLVDGVRQGRFSWARTLGKDQKQHEVGTACVDTPKLVCYNEPGTTSETVSPSSISPHTIASIVPFSQPN